MLPGDAHRALIERYVAAYNAFDVPGLLALLDAEIVFQNVENGRVTVEANGIEEFRQLAERAVQIFASRRQTILRYSPVDDGAKVDIDFEGVLAAELGPALRAGQTLRLSGRSTFAFRAGLIVRIIDES
jgi:hypothetical protein